MNRTSRGTISMAVALMLGIGIGCSRDPGDTQRGTAGDAPNANMGASRDAGDAPKANMGAAGQLNTDQFIAQAGSSGMAEVELSRLALSKSQSDAIKRFAQTMIDDHSKANEKLIAVAKSQGKTPPSSMQPKHRTAVDTLGKQQGAAFDQAYASQMLKDHPEAVQLFEKAAAATNVDAPIRQFARDTVPTLRQHLDHAKTLQGQVSQR